MSREHGPADEVDFSACANAFALLAVDVANFVFAEYLWSPHASRCIIVAITFLADILDLCLSGMRNKYEWKVQCHACIYIHPSCTLYSGVSSAKH